MFIFDLQVAPTINMCFNNLMFDLLFNYLLLSFRESIQLEKAEVLLEGVLGVQREEGNRRGQV